MVKYIMIFAAMLMMVACGDDTNKTPVDNMPAQDDTTTDIDNATDNVVVEEDVIVVDDTETSDEVVDDANDVTVEDSDETDADNLLIDEDEVIVTDDGETPDADVDSAPVPCTTENELRYLACGLNGNGTQKQKCTGGYWANDGSCDDPDECVANAEDEQSCGFNGNGTQSRSCALSDSWQWSSWTICDDPDECKNGSEGHPVDQDPDCGLNGRGKLLHVCTSGQWVVKSPEECEDPDQCVDYECIAVHPSRSYCCAYGKLIERPTQGCDVPCY